MWAMPQSSRMMVTLWACCAHRARSASLAARSGKAAHAAARMRTNLVRFGCLLMSHSFCLHEVVFDFFEKALLVGRVVDGQQLAQLLQQLLLLARQAGGHADFGVHVKIALAGSVEHRH